MKRKGRKEAGYEEPEQPQASRAGVARVKPILGNWETTFWHWEEMFILLNLLLVLHFWMFSRFL